MLAQGALYLTTSFLLFYSNMLGVRVVKVSPIIRDGTYVWNRKR